MYKYIKKYKQVKKNRSLRRYWTIEQKTPEALVTLFKSTISYKYNITFNIDQLLIMLDVK